MQRPLTALTALLLAACASESPLDCTPQNHCVPDNPARCEPGHTWLDPASSDDYRCVPESNGIRCGAGTVEVDGECQATALPPTDGLTCGPGTAEDGGSCVPTVTVSCGEATVQSGAVCEPDLAAICGEQTTVVGDRCVGSSAGPSCGVGTAESNGACIADLTSLCGAGSHPAGSECVADVGCGADTYEAAGVCRSSIVCGTGTARDGDACVADLATLCGPGTVVAANGCALPVDNPGLVALMADPNRVVAGHAYRGAPYCIRYNWVSECVEAHSDHKYRFLVTDFATSQAEAWAGDEIAPIGSGVGLHIQTSSYGAMAQHGPAFRDVFPSSADCSDYSPASSGSLSRAKVGFVTWSGGSWQPVACGVGGSISFDRDASDRLLVTLNVEMNDGTLLLDQTLQVSDWCESIDCLCLGEGDDCSSNSECCNQVCTSGGFCTYL